MEEPLLLARLAVLLPGVDLLLFTVVVGKTLSLVLALLLALLPDCDSPGPA